MADKHIVVQGAICKCQFGTAPDNLKVLTQSKHYATDNEGSKRLIATNKDIGAATLQKNTFGSCAKMNNNPCKPVITEWKGFYDKVTLSNQGKVLLEDSKAVCAVSGTPSIEILKHGQSNKPGKSSFKNTEPSVHGQLNPLVNIKDMLREARDGNGITLKK